jgi:hypothetical protein
MGLDMYLSKKTYVKYWESNGDNNYEVKVTRAGQPININPKKVSYIVEEVGYWRKANQIHDWFVRNVQDGRDNCSQYYVTKENLTELLDLCYQVKEEPIDAPCFLPVSSGCFFGSEEYDEYYFRQIDNTIQALESILENWDEEADYYYQSSW